MEVRTFLATNRSLLLILLFPIVSAVLLIAYIGAQTIFARPSADFVYIETYSYFGEAFCEGDSECINIYKSPVGVPVRPEEEGLSLDRCIPYTINNGKIVRNACSERVSTIYYVNRDDTWRREVSMDEANLMNLTPPANNVYIISEESGLFLKEGRTIFQLDTLDDFDRRAETSHSSGVSGEVVGFDR